MGIYIEPLDLQTLLINTFSGSNLVFLFVSLIAIFALSAVFKLEQGSAFLIVISYLIIIGYYVNAIFFTLAVVSGLAYAVMSILKAMGKITS
jgi:hypothetical protein